MAAIKEFKVLWGMLIDLDKCTGCGACTVACQAENNVAISPEGDNKVRSISWMKVYALSNGKAFPDYDAAYLPRPCMQCGKPSCVSVCPVVATDKNEEGGIVSQIHPRCIGCRYCMASCPYHARYFNWGDPVWPKGMEKTLTPDVSVRPRGVVEKCSFCHHRLMAAKDKARANGEDPARLADGAYQTTCTQACPNGAIVFGDIKNEDHQIAKLIKEPNVFRLLERLGTDPQVYYTSRREWVRRLGDNYLEQEKTKTQKG